MVRKVPLPRAPLDPDFIYRPRITLRDGRRIYANDRGSAAFKIRRRH